MSNDSMILKGMQTQRFVTAGKSRVVTMMFATLLATSVSGCAFLKSPPPPRDTFELAAMSNSGGKLGSTQAQLLVKLPNALKSIDNDRIIVRSGTSGVTYLSGAQWADTIPRMVQAKLVEAFENSSSTGATAKPGDGLVIDYQLISDIRRFEVSEKGTAVVEMSIKLLSDKTGKVLETRIFTATAQSAGFDAEAYVSAFDAAFAQLSRSVISWVLARV